MWVNNTTSVDSVGFMHPIVAAGGFLSYQVDGEARLLQEEQQVGSCGLG